MCVELNVFWNVLNVTNFVFQNFLFLKKVIWLPLCVTHVCMCSDILDRPPSPNYWVSQRKVMVDIQLSFLEDTEAKAKSREVDVKHFSIMALGDSCLWLVHQTNRSVDLVHLPYQIKTDHSALYQIKLIWYTPIPDQKTDHSALYQIKYFNRKL